MKKLITITLLLTLSATAVAQTYPAGAFVTKWAIKPGGDDITILTLEDNIGIDDLIFNPPYAPAHTEYDYNYTINWGDPGSPSNEEIITDATPPSHHYENTGANARIITITITSNNSVDGFPRMAFDFSKNAQKEMAKKLRSVEQWGTIRWQSMGRAFWGCLNLQINAEDMPNLSEVTHMNGMFQHCPQIDNIPNVNDWNVTNVINMTDLFLGASKFDQDISGWNVTNVKTMNTMFANADAFDQDISGWNVSNVTDMYFMFLGADNFNQDLSSWDVSSVTNMNSMFNNAPNFDQDLGSWDLSSVGDMSHMLGSTAMSCTNYSATLIGWATNNPSKMAMNLGVVGHVEFVNTNRVETPREYGTNAADVVRILTDERGWTFDLHIESEGECLLFEIDPIDDVEIDENTAFSITPNLTGPYIGSVTYTLDGTDAGLFDVNNNTGEVFLMAHDFEEPEDFDEDNVYEVTLIATDENGNHDREDWTVTVENVSETVTFTIDDIANISIQENTGYAGPVPSLSGSMPAGQVIYTLEGTDADRFTINSNSGQVSMIARNFEAPVDADMDNVYEVIITATDSDGNHDSEDWTVTIENVIEPVNFNIIAIPDEHVDENIPYTGPTPSLDDTSIKVTYTLSGPDAAAFTINGSTGVVRMIARDYENPADANGNNIYEVLITATDNDGNNDNEDWTVTVDDVDELSMINFTIDPIADAQIDENTSYTGPTPSLSGDTPVGSVTYTLGGTDAVAFTINSSSGQVSMIARDYENPADANGNNVYEVLITATDNDGNNDSEDWTVTVDDVDELSMKNFTIDPIADAHIDENTSYTGPTPALSGDTPVGSVTYTLGGTDAAAFTINSSTGVVRMIAQDYENPADANGNNIYEVLITATDEDSNSATEDWTVTVDDVDDTNAFFAIISIPDVQINENTPYTSNTPDLSGTPVGLATYTLGGADAEALTIDENSGIVFMVARDFENPADANMDNIYEILITATDEDSNVSTASWTVTVLDILDEQSGETLSIPTAFTPNGDGANDTWMIDDLASDALVVIRNRQGTILFESRNYAAQPWDGSHKGDVLPAGPYLFTIRNGTELFRGTVVILK